MAAPRQFQLFVRNKRDEYITTIEVHHNHSQKGEGGHDGRTSYGHEGTTDILPSKCVVVDYTRDRDVLETTADCAGALTMMAVREENKLKSFRSYLVGRKKAAVVKLPGGGRLCLLPVSGSSFARGESILALMQGNSGSGGSGGGAARGSVEEAPGSQSQGEAPGRAPPVGDSDGDGSGGDAGGGVGGLLGSIMGTISKTHKGVADTATVDKVARAQEQAIKRRVERFKLEVREKMEAFSTDPSSISHAFPHVEKSLRAVQHGLAEDFDGITTRTEGDIDDKHVVVYKLGYEPPDDEVQLDPQVRVGTARKASSGPASAAPMPAIFTRGKAGGEAKGPDAGDLVRIGTIVKDRRTVQEIEQDSRKRRRHGYDQ